MKTKNIFFAGALLLSAMSTTFFTSCVDEETHECNRRPEVINLSQETKDKEIETTVQISEDIADLYDLTVVYNYNGRSFEEKLEDLNKHNSVKVYSRDSEPTIYNYRICGITRHFGEKPLSITVCATPKAGVVAVAENMPEDKKIDFVFNTKTVNRNDSFDSFSKLDVRKGSLGMDKATFIEQLQKGKLTLDTLKY